MATMKEKNERGTRHAQAALDAYREAHKPGEGRGADLDDETAIGDLIVDLLHLAAANRKVEPWRRHLHTSATSTEIEGLLDRARDHYTHESNPEHADEEV